jgi:hypothetical protein
MVLNDTRSHEIPTGSSGRRLPRCPAATAATSDNWSPFEWQGIGRGCTGAPAAAAVRSVVTRQDGRPRPARHRRLHRDCRSGRAGALGVRGHGRLLLAVARAARGGLGRAGVDRVVPGSAPSSRPGGSRHRVDCRDRGPRRGRCAGVSSCRRPVRAGRPLAAAGHCRGRRCGADVAPADVQRPGSAPLACSRPRSGVRSAVHRSGQERTTISDTPPWKPPFCGTRRVNQMTQ